MCVCVCVSGCGCVGVCDVGVCYGCAQTLLNSENQLARIQGAGGAGEFSKNIALR